jgi:hypothetical protein
MCIQNGKNIKDNNDCSTIGKRMERNRERVCVCEREKERGNERRREGMRERLLFISHTVTLS